MTEKFDSDFGLLSNSSNDIFPNDNMFDGETGGNDVQPDDVIIIYMDITEPLSKLKTLLEQKVGMALKKYRFWLQDAQMLEPHKNLVDQCVEGEGIVQINVQLQAINRRINIVDVLKPTEESLEFLANELSLPDTKPFNDLKMDDNRNNTDSSDDGDEDDDDGSKGGGHARDRDDDDNSNDIIKNIFNDDELTPKWILDNNCKFKKDQARLNIPDDPSEWSTSQVQHWLQWAVREFHMTQIKFSDWLITGKQLCEMPLTEFDKIVPYDPGNIFRTHFELLRKCKFVAVLQNRKTLDLKIFGAENNTKPVRVMKKMPKKVTASINDDKHYMLSDTLHRNPVGQIQLWQFLLDLLTDHEYRSIIHWITPDGEFRLADPEQVAKLWGLRKNKPSMNYEKLSRALRYYYDGDMISKVHGKRFVYKFVCNLKQLIGYDARELARLIAHCAMMKKKEKADKNAHNI